ncbi:MAG: SPOR domain-containing protein [Azoarcus sp.]|jgi:cell division septation protein DedD|nr:SPOR domain-containing protein [Azoarcus sp.]
MRRHKVSFSSDLRWTAMKRAGLAVAAALLLLLVMLWFGDSGQPSHPPPESANALPPKAETPVLPESGTTAQTAAEPVVAPAPVSGETGHVPSAIPGLDAAVAAPDTTAPPEPMKATTSPQQEANAPMPSKAANAPMKPSASPDGYFIQLGVFNDTENASKVLDNVTALGLPAHTQMRVMVGPFRNKSEAEAARDRLKDIAEGTVLPPQKTAKASGKPKSKSRQRAR